MKTDVLHYRIELYKYGIIPILLLLDHFEKQEKFEECAKIVEAIKINSKLIRRRPQTRLTQKVIDSVMRDFKKFNLKPEFLMESSKYYVELMLNDISNK